MKKKNEATFILNSDIKKWRQRDYYTSIDAEFEKRLAEITGLQNAFIIIWKAERNALTKEFDYYEFQYGNKYFQLKKNKLKEITREDVFGEKKKR